MCLVEEEEEGGWGRGGGVEVVGGEVEMDDLDVKHFCQRGPDKFHFELITQNKLNGIRSSLCLKQAAVNVGGS